MGSVIAERQSSSVCDPRENENMEHKDIKKRKKEKERENTSQVEQPNKKTKRGNASVNNKIQPRKTVSKDPQQFFRNRTTHHMPLFINEQKHAQFLITTLVSALVHRRSSTI